MQPRNFPYLLTACVICVANSRVGVKINMRGVPLFFCMLKRCSAGNTNAAVLPVPVCAEATISFPSKISGIDLAWMGVGC